MIFTTLGTKQKRDLSSWKIPAMRMKKMAADFDYLVVSRAHRVISVHSIEGYRTGDGSEILFHLGDAPEWLKTRVGNRLPEKMVWKKGESFPIKAVDTDLIMKEWEIAPVGTSPDNPLVFRGASVWIDDSGQYFVKLPRGATLTTITSP